MQSPGNVHAPIFKEKAHGKSMTSCGVCQRVCERERPCVCVCVCERERSCVCVAVIENEIVCVCVCVTGHVTGRESYYEDQ